MDQFKFLIRQLVAGKMYTLINVIGLAIGITSIVWGYQTYRYSMSFDNFHKNRGNIYRVLSRNDGNERYNGYCPMPVGLFAKNDFSSIKDYVRWERNYTTIKSNKEEALGASVHFTDPAFFSFFNFPLIKGSNDLNDKSSLLMTETESKKFFGNADPLGQVLTLYTGESYQISLTVKGILKDPPMNSSIQFGMITNFDNFIKEDGSKILSDDWKWFADALFLHIPEKSDASRLSSDIAKYIPAQNSARPDNKIAEYKLESMYNVANHPDDDLNGNALVGRPDDSAVYGPLVLAILILLSSCLNFANTTVARSNKRLKEMAVRKVMGSTISQLISRQLIESGAIVFLGMLLSLAFTAWWLPKFNSMFDGIKLNASYLSDMPLLYFMIFLLIAVTILAGIYPAYYISRYHPTKIFRGGLNHGGSNLISRALLGLQIAIAFITVTAAFGFARNAAFQRDFDFGFNQNQVLGIDLPKNAYAPLKDALSKMPDIKVIGGSKGHIAYSWRELTLEAESKKTQVAFLEVGENYLELMDIKLLKGRYLNSDTEADYKHSAVVSPDLCAQYGWTPEQALNKIIQVDTTLYSIVGVTSPLYMGGFFGNPQPTVFVPALLDQYRFLLVKSDQSKLKSIQDQIKATWSSLYPNKIFNAFYQDEMKAEAQKVTINISTIFLWFSIISVLLTSTGMFALITLTIMKRTREIAIRRVVGAEIMDIAYIINKGYLIIIFIGGLLGIFAGISLTKLLLDLIFKVNNGINTSVVLSTIIGVTLIIAAVISIKLLQVNKMKPASVLKSS